MSGKSRICFTVDSDMVEHIVFRLEDIWGIKNASVDPVFSGTRGEYLRMLRKKKGWTQLTLANLAGLKKQGISRFETDIRPITVGAAISLGKLFGVNPLSFLMEE